MWDTRITKLLGIRYPIIQGGLAHLAYAELAAAVSNAGGLGQITAMSLPHADSLREEIRKTRALTNRPFGVNFAIGRYGRAFEDYLLVAVEEEIPVISITGGNPSPVLDRLKGVPVKKLVLVASVRQAQKAERLGADAVIVVGQEGGGHIGRDDLSTFVLVPRVADSVNIPVIASGGIADGRGMMAAFALGAEGVEMGTRFVATRDCIHAHPRYKEALLSGKETDTIVIKRSLGAPGRVIKNDWAMKILEMENRNTSYEELKDFISGEANIRLAREGDWDHGFAWAGQAMGLIHDIPTVEELFHRMLSQAEEIRKSWTPAGPDSFAYSDI